MPKILPINSAKHYGLTFGQIDIGRYPGGEVSLTIKEPVAGEDVIIVGSTNAPAENLLEMIFAIEASKNLGAKKITAVIPYFAYARADREKFAGQSISAKVVAGILEKAGGENFQIATIDIHGERIRGFFKAPFTSVSSVELFADKFKDIPDLSLVAPDKGAEIKVNEFAEKLGIGNVAVIQKERMEDGSVQIKGIEGNIGKKVLITDDIVDSGGTIIKSAEFLKEHGAEEIYIAATHMVWQGGGYNLMASNDSIKKVYTTDTVTPPSDVPEKIEVIPIKPLLEKIINV